MPFLCANTFKSSNNKRSLLFHLLDWNAQYAKTCKYICLRHLLQISQGIHRGRAQEGTGAATEDSSRACYPPRPFEAVQTQWQTTKNKSTMIQENRHSGQKIEGDICVIGRVHVLVKHHIRTSQERISQHQWQSAAKLQAVWH